MANLHASVIGAGLAGTEAAMQLSKRGIWVTLFEMKPKRFSAAHCNQDLAELVCSIPLRRKDKAAPRDCLRRKCAYLALSAFVPQKKPVCRQEERLRLTEIYFQEK